MLKNKNRAYQNVIFIVVMFFIILFPWNIKAEEIQKEKINIYFFKKTGCMHCSELEEFFTEIEEEYGKYYNLVTYDIYENRENEKLMEKVSNKMKDNARGVPYIIIGEYSLIGYSKKDNEDILSTIKKEYEKTESYDIMNHLNDRKEKSRITDVVVLSYTTLIIGGIWYIRSMNQ